MAVRCSGVNLVLRARIVGGRCYTDDQYGSPRIIAAALCVLSVSVLAFTLLLPFLPCLELQ